MKEKQPEIRYLFEPRAIAVIGASQQREKIGYKLVENILSDGYRGKVYAVNPRGGEVLGLRAHRAMEEIDDEIDLACIAIPASLVFEALKSCGHKKVKFVLIITSGDRSDILLAALETDTACVVLTNNILPPPGIIAKANEHNIPMLLVPQDTFQAARRVDRIEALSTKDDTERIELLRQLIEQYLDVGEIARF